MTRFFIKKPVFSFVAMIVVLLIGIVSIMNTPKQLMPDIEAPIVNIVSVYPGAGADEINEKVTKPLEESLGGLGGLKVIQSTSSENQSNILLTFDWDSNIDEVESEIKSKISGTLVPEEVEPKLYKFSTADFPVIQVAFSSNDLNDSVLKSIEDVKSELLKVDGVGAINISNTSEKFIDIELNRDELEEFGLPVSQVANVLKTNNFSFPASLVEKDGEQFTSRLSGELSSIEEVRNVVVGFNAIEGKNITLGEVADVTLKRETRNSINRLDGKEAVVLDVTQKGDANTSQVSKDVLVELESLVDNNETGLKYDVLFDQGDYVDKSIGNVTKTVLLGGLLAIIVLLYFLKSFRTALIISVAIPFSLLSTFIFFYYFDFTLNIMTLGGLALAVGMLVDNSIVVLENIYRHMEKGKDKKVAALEGTKEIAPAITASTLTTIAVFLPLSFATGIVKVMFSEFSLTVVFALLSSLVVSLTIIPTLGSLILNSSNRKSAQKGSKVFKVIAKRALKHRAVTIVIVLFLLVLGAFGLTKTGMEFMPSSDQGFFTVQMYEKDGKKVPSDEKVVESIETVEKLLIDKNEVENVLITYDDSAPIGTMITVVMADMDKRDGTTSEYISEYREELESDITELKLVFSEQESTGAGTPNTLTFTVGNSNKDALDTDVRELVASLEDIEDVVVVETNVQDMTEEVNIKFNREELNNFGLSAMQVASEVSDASREQLVTTISSENDLVDVKVKVNPEQMDAISDLETFKVQTPSGEEIELQDVADFSMEPAVPSIIRINREEKININVKYKEDAKLSQVTAAVNDEIDGIDLNDDTDITFTGDQKMLDDSIESLMLALVLSVVLVYLVIAAQFESFKNPFIIMFSIPLIIVGIGISLMVTNTPVSVVVLIGIILLAGIVVNNAIVLIDFINQRKTDGQGTYEAILEAVEVRTRPILMTALTTILGLLPLAFGIGEGAEMQQPMAIAVIGGLVSSTFLTLVVIPVIYSLFDKETRKMNSSQKVTKEDYFIIKKSELEKNKRDEIENLLNK